MQPHRRHASRTGLALIAVLTAVAACDREAPAPPPQVQTPAPASAPTPPAPKPTYTLILTWMYGSQPPQTTQTVFHDESACDHARDAAIAESRRLALESIGDTPSSSEKSTPPASRRYIGSALLPGDEASPAPASATQSTPPEVSALCAATSAP